MDVLNMFWFVIAICLSTNTVCSYKSVPPAKVADGGEIKWYYVPEFLIQESRERSPRGLAITCQSRTLCGIRRTADEIPAGVHVAMQYCDCPDGEECRKIEVIEPNNFTYYRCMVI